MKIPSTELEKLSPVERDEFLKWDDFMHREVKFNLPGSEIHASEHCERVLLYAIILGYAIFGDDKEALEILAQAAVFHDTRRQDDYLDTGHGARAAVYYEKFCKEHPEVKFHPETMYLMRYHDLDDKKGVEAIVKEFGAEAPKVVKLYQIFKDSDALDRWRLGSRGLDPRFLRTEQSKAMIDYARRIVKETIPAEVLKAVEDEVNAIIEKHKQEKSHE